MKIIIPHNELINVLELISRISTKHVTLPVLQCVLIEARDTTIVFRATNLEIGIEATTSGQIITDGVVAVPAQTLLQAVQYISKKDVTLSVEDSVCVVESGTSVTKINTAPFDEFPTITKITDGGIMMDRKQFSLGIKTVAFAASVSSIKPELGSVFIQQKKEHTLTFVATDSFRLMEKTVSQKGCVLSQSILIPQKNALELARVCDLLETDPELIINDNQCALWFKNGVYITSRLVSGSFPDYEQIIPKEYITNVTVLKQDIVQLLKKTHIFLNKFMQVTLAVGMKEVTASSQNGDVGTTTDTITAQVEGEELTLNFNQQYVIDPFQHISDEQILLKFAGIGRPLVMTGVHDTTLRYLVMPMNR